MSIKKALGWLMVILPSLALALFMINEGVGWILLVCVGFFCLGITAAWLLCEQYKGGDE